MGQFIGESTTFREEETFELHLEGKFSILQSVMVGNGIPESE